MDCQSTRGGSKRLWLRCSIIVGVFVSGSFGQQRVDLRNTYQRVLARVSMVGDGSAANPRRPEYAPLPPRSGEAPSRAGIVAYSYQLSDDGKTALVEFVAQNRSAFAALLADTRPTVKAFEKGKAKRADIEAEFKKYKKDFDLNKFQGVRVQ